MTPKTCDSRGLIEQSRMNKALEKAGLAKLHEEGLLDQMAVCIRDHEHFRKILVKVHPEQRTDCYEGLAPRLTFKARPLAEYVAEATNAAAESVSRCEPVIVGKKPSEPKTLEQIAEHSIGMSMAMDNARGRLTLVCSKCTNENTIYAADRMDALATFNSMGWRFEHDKPICGECAHVIVLA